MIDLQATCGTADRSHRFSGLRPLWVLAEWAAFMGVSAMALVRLCAGKDRAPEILGSSPDFQSVDFGDDEPAEEAEDAR